MSTKEELILENELLKRKLSLAEAWMKREVAIHQKKFKDDGVKTAQRKQLDNVLERESVNIITKKIENYFGESLKKAPKFTLHHLIDSEIYWQTLQKFPSLDALPVVSSYQKILESVFERIIAGFRIYENRKGIKQIKTRLYEPYETQSSFDKDIENILEKKYSLSLGRWFHFFQKLRDGSTFGGKYEDRFLDYMTHFHESFLEGCISEPFYSQFLILVQLEVFGKKRHESKVTYQDAKVVREICMGSDNEKSPLLFLFRNIG